MTWLGDKAAIKHFPRGQLKSILELARPDLADPDVLDTALSARIATLYPQDCKAFGYEPTDPTG